MKIIPSLEAKSTRRPRPRPIIIAHRGASADRPEHTLAAYREGIAQGADYIEPDLVMTRDGVLVARHENEIGGTTDVAARAEFADRRTDKMIDGQKFSGWFVEDFTLAELKTLRARERLPRLRDDNTRYDGQFDIPTFDEILALANAESARLGRRIGVYPETKHPTYHRRIGLPQEATLLAQLNAAGFSSAADPVFIQSFEVGNLQALRKQTSIRLIQLIDAQGCPADTTTRYADMLTADGLKAIARYADGIGAAKHLLIRVVGEGAGTPEPTGVIAAAHRAGLLVHGWTFRPESEFLLRPFAGGRASEWGDGPGEAQLFIGAGIDGLFADHPADVSRAMALELGGNSR